MARLNETNPPAKVKRAPRPGDSPALDLTPRVHGKVAEARAAFLILTKLEPLLPRIAAELEWLTVAPLKGDPDGRSTSLSDETAALASFHEQAEKELAKLLALCLEVVRVAPQLDDFRRGYLATLDPKRAARLTKDPCEFHRAINETVTHDVAHTDVAGALVGKHYLCRFCREWVKNVGREPSPRELRQNSDGQYVRRPVLSIVPTGDTSTAGGA
jgi:hypothetical protein